MCPPGLALASGGLQELPHAAESGTRVIPPHARLAGHGGADALSGLGRPAAGSPLAPSQPGHQDAEPPAPGAGSGPVAATISTANTAFVPGTPKCSLMNHLHLPSTAQ